MFGLIFCRISRYFIAFFLYFCIAMYSAVSAIAFPGILIASCVVSQYAFLYFCPAHAPITSHFPDSLIRLFPFLKILVKSGGSLVSIIMRMCLALMPRSSVPAARLGQDPVVLDALLFRPGFYLRQAEIPRHKLFRMEA